MLRYASYIIFFIIFFSIDLDAIGQTKESDELTVKVQLRPRFEYRDGTFRPLSKNEKPAILVSSRTRLGIEYSSKEKISFGLVAQAVNLWGESAMVQGLGTPGSALQIFEAWGNIKFKKWWAIKFGRQIISLDDERIFGALDWAQGARAHDALSAAFNRNKVELKTFFAYNQNYRRLYGDNISNPSGSLYDVAQAYPYKAMQTLWLKFPLAKHVDMSILGSNLTLQNAASRTDDAPVYNLQTAGLNLYVESNPWKASATGYLQHGKNLAGEKVNAYLIAGQLSYKFTKQFSATIGNDFLSGRRYADSPGVNHSFQPSLGTNHKFYGAMDYFFAGNPHKDKGLNDAYIKGQYKEGSVTASCAVHRFSAAQKIKYSAGKMEGYLGTEIDTDVNIALNAYTNITGGYSFLFASDALNSLKAVANPQNLQQWAYLSINLNPKILNIKHEYNQPKQ